MREDPTSYEVADGELTITTTEGDLYQTPNAAEATNFVLQSDANLPADYAAETQAVGDVHRRLRPGGPAHLRRRRQLRQARPHLRHRAGPHQPGRAPLGVGGAIQNPQPQIDLPANVTSYRLRLTKEGTSYLGEVAVDGG